MRLVTSAVIGGVALLSLSPALAAAATVGFEGTININGAFPVVPDPVGQPVVGTLTWNPATPGDLPLADGQRYTDLSGVLSATFGVGGSLTTFTSNSGLLLSVSNIGGNTSFRAEGFDGGAFGSGRQVIVLFRFPGLDATGPAHALPGNFTTANLLAGNIGNGSIHIGGGLTSFVISAVPEPTTLAVAGGALAVLLRRQRR